MTRDIAPFGLRMPPELKARIDRAAATNGRSINSEIIDRITRSFAESEPTDLGTVPSGVLLEAVLTRFGARLELVISQEVADQEGVSNSVKK